jgi:hypothetical protein
MYVSKCQTKKKKLANSRSLVDYILKYELRNTNDKI